MIERNHLGRRCALATTLLSAAAVLLIVSSPRMHALYGSPTDGASRGSTGQAASVIVPFDADHWYLDDGSTFVPFAGRNALAGTAYVKGLSFLNGTI